MLLRTPEVNIEMDYELPNSNDFANEDDNIDDTLYDDIEESDIQERRNEILNESNSNNYNDIQNWDSEVENNEDVQN